MCWWALFRVFTLFHLLSSTEHSQAQEESKPELQSDITAAFWDAVGVEPRSTCGNSTTVPSPSEWRKPICRAGVGCDVPLNCFNYSSLNATSNTTAISGRGVVKVTAYELEGILEDPSVAVTCAVVMIYAPWCPFSVNFARQYNALGRTYRELPVLAIDLSENDLYKYLTAYIPLVTFYYRGKAIYRFKATESYEELVEQITKMTGFQPIKIDLNDSENEYPVPMVGMEILRRAVKASIPPLSFSRHKGEAGRIGIIGGSLEYTGAPYFAAISAMKTGADLVHVFCPENAAQVIKSYSPELIVHPLLSSTLSEEDVVESITAWFPRLHALIFGPGLGRDPLVLSRVKKLIQVAKEMEKSIVIDADGLHLVINDASVITGYPKAILTPNGGEFPVFYEKMLGEKIRTPFDLDRAQEETKLLAAKMGGVTVVRKGRWDVISNGTKVIQCEEEGCMRRCGGQGDVLAGIIGLFSFWTAESEKRLVSEFDLPSTLVAAYGGCLLTKKCAEAAFEKNRRSMLAHNVVNEIPSTFYKLFDENGTH